MFIKLCILLLIQTLPDTNHHPVAHKTFSLSRKDLIIQGENRKGPYRLPDIFIIENSIIVRKDTLVLKKDNDYFANNKSGTIFFFDVLEKNDYVTITYRFFPFPIQREYRTRNISSYLREQPVTKHGDMHPKTSNEHEKGSIIIGGAKTFSIGVNSSQGFSFDQSLLVNISGEITKGLSINGVLSDENTPLEPEGTTETLEELDRIYVTIRGSNISATLGDYKLDYVAARTPILQRELLGVTGNLRRAGAEMDVAFGIPRGKFHSLHLKGIESTQGPYQLTSSEGEEDIVIVAGTETVYLDGILIKRGEKNDYTMDYNQAQITFTTKRVITDETDIVVEFQYTRIGFRRNTYATNVRYRKSYYSIGTFLVRDADDVSQTEGFELTNEKKEFLANLGDDTTKNWMESGVYVGDGKGDYSLTDSFYVFRGYRKGEWNVSFTYIGEANGDYLYSDSLSGFLFVGQNTGNYVSKIRVSLPEKEDYGGVHIGYDDRKRVTLSGEFFGSQYDRNILSPINDNDNRGFFSKFNGDVKLFQSQLGSMNAFGGYSFRNKTFHPLSRIEKSNFEKRWNLERTQGKEEIRNGGATFHKENLVHSRVNISSLRREQIHANLKEVLFSMNRKTLPQITLTARTVSIQGDTALKSVTRYGASITYGIWKLLPKAFVNQELRNEPQKKRWREAGGELGFRLLSNSKCAFGYSKRFDDILSISDSLYERESHTITKTILLETEESRLFRSNLTVTSRVRKFTPQFPGANSELVLIEFFNHFIPSRRRLDIETNYSVTGKNSILFKEIFYEVEEGKGNFSKDSASGDYFPDTLGNYKQRIERVGEGNPVTALQAYVRVRFVPAKFLKCNFTTSVSEENTSADKFSIYLLRLNRFLSDSLTEAGRQSLDGNISVYPLKTTTVSYSFNFLKGVNNKLVTRSKRDYSDRQNYRIEQRLTKRTRVAFGYEKRRKTEKSIEQGTIRHETRESFSPEFSYLLLDNLEAKIKATSGNIIIEEPLWYSHLGQIPIKSETITPALNYTFVNSAVIDASIAVIRNTTPIDENDLPFDVRSFYPKGITTDWKLRTTISFSKVVSVNISYNGLNRPDKKTIHSANAELRADF